MSASETVIRHDALRLLVERRIEIYARIAALLMDLEGALATDDWEQARYQLVELRRILRTSLAFLTDEVYEELEQIEDICNLGTGVENIRRPANFEALLDHLQLLHMKFSRALREPTFQDLESIVGVDVRLKRKLKASRRDLAEKVKQRENEEAAWDLEAQARVFLKNKEPKKALNSILKALELAPNRAVFHNDLGFVYGQLSRLIESVQAYRQAINLNEIHPELRTEEWTTSYYNLGVALRKLASKAFRKNERQTAFRYTSEALDHFETYLSVCPSGQKAAMVRQTIVELLEVHDILQAQVSAETVEQTKPNQNAAEST